LFFFLLSFCTLHIFEHNLRMPTPIKLKLGIHKGLIKAHFCTNFGWNPIRVMIDFSHKKRSKVCHAYRVNHWKELEYVGGVNIVGVSFCGFKGNTKSNQCQNDAIKFVKKICPVTVHPFRVVS